MTEKQRKLRAFILTLAVPPVAAVGVTIILFNWNIPTRIGFEVTTREVQFTVGRAGQNKAIPILDSMSFQSVAVENFSGIQFTPNEIFVADPAQYDFDNNSYPPSAWKPLLTHNNQVKIKPLNSDQDARVTIESAEGAGPESRRLDELRGGPGSVVKWRTAGERQMTLKVSNNGEQDAIGIALLGTGQIVTEHCSLEGVGQQPRSDQSLTYQVRLPDADPTLQMSGRNNSIVLIVTVPESPTPRELVKRSLPITAIDLTVPDQSTGDVTSALLKSGEVIYPGYPEKKVSFQAEDYLYLSGLESFSIQSLSFNPEVKGFTLRVDGLVGRFESGPSAFREDRRLTAFDYLKYSNLWVQICLVFVAVGAWAVKGWQLWQEFKKAGAA